MSCRIVVRCLGIGLLGFVLLAEAALAREWTDASGHFTLAADLVSATESLAVLKRADGSLVALPVEKLSKADREYLKSKEAQDSARKSADQLQTWTLHSGVKLVGKVVDYGRKDVTIQRRRGRIYVNDRVFENLPELYQQIVPRIVGHFEKQPIESRANLESWVLQQRGQARTFTCEGVLLELENGDEYGVPFFLLSAADLKVLEPGWKEWAAIKDDAQKQADQQLLLQSQAQQYQQDQKRNQQIALMQLELQAFDAGLFSLWEVQLLPTAGGRPFIAVVPGRNSEDAARTALTRNPGYSVGGIARIRRQN
jgi:hypothetical protein